MTERKDPAILDARQLVRIEAVHRGFLFQHLYAAECLLQAGASGTARLVVERDEDIELVRSDHRLYVQVKTRSDTLAPADVSDALARFADIRQAHKTDNRSGAARFVIASNVAPSAKLLSMRADAEWPADVELNWPTGPDPHPGLPRPAPDIAGAVRACIRIAGSLPFAMLRAETLVWKLAGAVTLAATGEPPREDHGFTAEELPALFEQLVVDLQDLPAPPIIYRSQIDEPPLLTNDPVRILSGLSGLSGLGKTTWVAEAAVHASASVIYLDVADVPGAAIASTVTREVAARMFGRTKGALGEILLPGASPLETIGLLSTKLGQEGMVAHVVLDNAHHLPAADIRALVGRAPHLRFLLLCQPSSAVVELEKMLAIVADTLGGWDEDTIAAAITDEGCFGDYRACEQLSRLTGALPFYVLNAAIVAAREYGGSIAALCADIDMQTHFAEVAQEIILRRAFDGLPPEQAETVGVLSLADVTLSRDDAVTVISQALSIDERAVATRFRALPSSGMLELFGNAGLKIHDAVRTLGRAYVAKQGAAFEQGALTALRDVLLASIRREWSVGKLGLADIVEIGLIDI